MTPTDSPKSHIIKGIEARMKALMTIYLDGEMSRPWKAMEEKTGVKAVKWRHFHAGVKQPSVEMLSALCTAFPEYAFWLSTGISNYHGVHGVPDTTFPVTVSPEIAEIVDLQVASGRYPSKNAVILDALLTLTSKKAE